MVVSKPTIDSDNFAWIDSLATKYDMSHSEVVKEALDYVRISGDWRLDEYIANKRLVINYYKPGQ